MPFPKVSLIILNYNGWKDTLECLESVRKLDYPNFEVRVVDNASTDDSWQSIQDWMSSHSKNLPFTLLQSGANRGYAGGNNVGIRHALEQGADYVWILNNDTAADSAALSAMVTLAESDPRIGMVGPTTFYFDEPSKAQAMAGGRINRWVGTSQFIVKPDKADGKLDYISGASILAKAAMVREIGFLDERFFFYWEDADWSLRARQSGWKLAHAWNARIRHKVGRTIGPSSPRTDYHHARSGLLFYMKHRKAFYPWTPALFLAAKIGRRVLGLNGNGLRAVFRAARDAFQQLRKVP